MARIIKPYSSGLVTTKLMLPASTGKLPIDTNHPLSVGLTSAFLPGLTMGEDHTNNCKRLDYFDNGAALASTGTLVGTPEGPSMGCSTANRRSLSNVNGILPLSISKWTTEASFYVRFFQAGSAGSANAVFFVDDGAQPAMGMSAVAASNTFTFYYVGFAAATTGAAVTTNKVHGALVSLKVGGLTSNMWMDGAAYTSSTAVANPTNTAATTAMGMGQNTDVRIIALYTWRRALSQQEAVLLESDPYCIFQSPATNLWYSAAYPTQFAAADDTQPQFARWTRTERATALASTSEAVGPVAPPETVTFVASPDEIAPARQNYTVALESTTHSVLPVFLPTRTPSTYLELFITDDRPLRADIIGVALKATTSPIWPQAPPPTTATQTPSIWFSNPDCTLPDWW